MYCDVHIFFKRSSLSVVSSNWQRNQHAAYCFDTWQSQLLKNLHFFFASFPLQCTDHYAELKSLNLEHLCLCTHYHYFLRPQFIPPTILNMHVHNFSSDLGGYKELFGTKCTTAQAWLANRKNVYALLRVQGVKCMLTLSNICFDQLKL